MKILYITTVGGTMNFFPEHLEMLIDGGNEVELACNYKEQIKQEILNLNLKIHDISFSRNPFSKDNILAYKQLKKLIKENNYDLIHCHTPNASAITRFVCRNHKKSNLKVIYTAHGFHFYKGAPLKNWLIYFPVEKICSLWTDVLITINLEDYNFAKKHLNSKVIKYVPGVGININNFNSLDNLIRAKKIKQELGIPEDCIVLLSVGELNINKNHQVVVKALSKINDLNIHYVVAGKGDEHDNLIEISNNLGLSNNIHLLGFRNDVSDLYQMADIYILPSLREGLNVSIMEAMSSGLPCIVSKIRGNVDLIDEKGGNYFIPYDVEECKKAIINLLSQNLTNFGLYNKNKVKNFSSEVVLEKIEEIYTEMY